MIKSFPLQGFDGSAIARVSCQEIRRLSWRKPQEGWRLLDNAKNIHDLMGLPSNRFEALSGNRSGQFSIRVNQQWRICFEWKDADAYNVEIVDYH